LPSEFKDPHIKLMYIVQYCIYTQHFFSSAIKSKPGGRSYECEFILVPVSMAAKNFLRRIYPLFKVIGFHNGLICKHVSCLSYETFTIKYVHSLFDDMDTCLIWFVVISR
jgi:hypothetical protein